MGLLTGKRGLIMGVANDRSIAWGMAKRMAEQGAELAFTYQNETMKKRVQPLAESLNSKLLVECDVTNEAALDQTFEDLAKVWDKFDFVVHAIAFSDKNELKNPFIETSLENFSNSMHISCYSLVSVARRAAPMLNEGGSIMTLSYIGSQRVMPNYNVMGVAKAALETSVKYLAADLGEQGVRINTISAGPVKTLAGSAIANARYTFKAAEKMSALNNSITLEQVGDVAVYLASDMSSAVTGETHYVDCGFNCMGMMKPHRFEEM